MNAVNFELLSIGVIIIGVDLLLQLIFRDRYERYFQGKIENTYMAFKAIFFIMTPLRMAAYPAYILFVFARLFQAISIPESKYVFVDNWIAFLMPACLLAVVIIGALLDLSKTFLGQDNRVEKHLGGKRIKQPDIDPSCRGYIALTIVMSLIGLMMLLGLVYVSHDYIRVTDDGMYVSHLASIEESYHGWNDIQSINQSDEKYCIHFSDDSKTYINEYKLEKNGLRSEAIEFIKSNAASGD